MPSPDRTSASAATLGIGRATVVKSSGTSTSGAMISSIRT